MRRRPPPTPPKLKRSGETIPLGPPLLIAVCEGGTEAKLLEQLRGHWRISRRRVHVEGNQGDPSNVVEVTRDRLQRGGRHVEAWAVFDRDEHPHWPTAIKTANERGIRLAISNPCFELWGILLHRDQTAHLDRHKAQQLLKKLHKGYDHARNPYLDVKAVLDALDTVDGRTRELSRITSANGDPHGNPSTSFGELVRSLQTRARE